jgi:hypothetical protein
MKKAKFTWFQWAMCGCEACTRAWIMEGGGRQIKMSFYASPAVSVDLRQGIGMVASTASKKVLVGKHEEFKKFKGSILFSIGESPLKGCDGRPGRIYSTLCVAVGHTIGSASWGRIERVVRKALKELTQREVACW